MEQSAGHGAIELGWSHIPLIVANIVDAIDKGRALASIARRVGRNLGGAGTVSKRTRGLSKKMLLTEECP